MIVLGVSAYYHDSAAAIVIDGQIIAAAQEERFTRKKHDPAFPKSSILYCLKSAHISLSEVDNIVFYEKPLLKFERLLETYLHFAPKGFSSFRLAMPIWLREKLFLKDLLKKEFTKLQSTNLIDEKILFSEHHLSHAASAFYPSPFEKAAILTLDGVGEWTTSSIAMGRRNNIEILKEINFPHSIGLLYSAMTYYLGFKVNSGEYKIMGLAPYGKPIYAQTIFDNLIDLKHDGSFRLNMDYFDFCTGLTMTNKKFDALFGAPPRSPESDLTQREMNLAASIQNVTEEVILRMTRTIHKETGEDNLCMAGGVALNCVANGKVLRDGSFKNIWIQPAAGDAGGALGAALVIYYMHHQKTRLFGGGQDAMQGAYLGPKFSQEEVETELRAAGAIFEVRADDEIVRECARCLADGMALGWMQGRMEFGPRSLGARSIIADARSSTMQSVLNLKIKYRESFRPFAPSILREHLSDWFALDVDSPYMLLVGDLAEEKRLPEPAGSERLFGIDKLKLARSAIPAVTHVDYSARIQTVHAETNPRYHELLTQFHALTGCPVLVNTSFNVRGEPIVCSPTDAFHCFMGTEIEVLAVENCLLYKDRQNPALKLDYKAAFEPD